ncbi:MAG: hypothetical protein WC384_10305 [Prolixibacteraceae bacterium]|jgi:hypothetical protein
MQFRPISNYIDSNTEEPVVYINRRLEYFHHYWNFLFKKNAGFLLLTHEKFESHRSLLDKVRLQAEVNHKECKHPLKRILFDHEYFKNDNILLRDDFHALNKINDFLLAFEQLAKDCRPKENDKEKSINAQTKIIGFIDDIKSSVLKNEYERIVINTLSKVLNINEPITPRVKKDLQFLINAAIVELFHFGYSSDYIKNIPEIIIFPKEIKGTEKTNLDQKIESLLDLLKPQKLNGFYIFKIDNIDLQEAPITIWDVTFYNPEKERRIVCERTDEWKKKIEDYEIFQTENDDNQINQNQASTCNAIVKIEYRPLFSRKPDNSLFTALARVEKSLDAFNMLNRNYIDNLQIKGAIKYSKYLLLSEGYSCIAIPPFIERLTQEPFKLTSSQNSTLKKNLSYINKLNPEIDFQKKLIDIYAYQCKANLDLYRFNFKDYWTVCCEAIFPNDTNGFIAFCKKCLRSRAQSALFLDTRDFLENTLTIDIFPGYHLNQEAMENIGIKSVKVGESYNTKEFENKYKQISDYLVFEFIQDIIDELDKLKRGNEYFEKLDKWLEKTIWEVYSERNLEVHNNIQTDLSLTKLRDLFLFIISIVYQTLMWNCDGHTNSIDEVIKRI